MKIVRIDYGFEIDGVRTAELSDEQLLKVAASGDPGDASLFPAGVQSAFAEAYWRRHAESAQ